MKLSRSFASLGGAEFVDADTIIASVVKKKGFATIDDLYVSPLQFIILTTSSNLLQILSLAFFLGIILIDCLMLHLVAALNPLFFTPLRITIWTWVCAFLYIFCTILDNIRNICVMGNTWFSLKTQTGDPFPALTNIWPDWITWDHNLVIIFIVFASTYDMVQNGYLSVAFYRHRDTNLNQKVRLAIAICMIIVIFIIDVFLISILAGNKNALIYSLATKVDVTPIFVASLGIRSSIQGRIYLQTKDIIFPPAEELLELVKYTSKSVLPQRDRSHAKVKESANLFSSSPHSNSNSLDQSPVNRLGDIRLVNIMRVNVVNTDELPTILMNTSNPENSK